MKRGRRLKLNTQLLAVFFGAVLLLSLGNFFVYGWLLNKLQQEQQIVNQERLDTVQVWVSETLKDFDNACNRLFQNEIYRNASKEQMQPYNQLEMHNAAKNALTPQYLEGYAIYVQGSDYVITNYGAYTLTQYSGMRKNLNVNDENWLNCFGEKFFSRCYSAGVYSYRRVNGQLTE